MYECVSVINSNLCIWLFLIKTDSYKDSWEGCTNQNTNIVMSFSATKIKTL